MAAPSRMGWTEVYIVDEHNCQLNTEPVCKIPTDYHPGFLKWLLQQQVVPQASPLLYHFDENGNEIRNTNEQK